MPGLSILDVAGAIRLCIALRQIKQMNARKQVAVKGKKGAAAPEEEWAWLKDLWTTLTIVYGGEVISGAMLQFPPSFLVYPHIPALFIVSHFAVNMLPEPPLPGLATELPLAVLDAFTRSTLLCNLAPQIVLNHNMPVVASSPVTLLVVSTLLANAGFTMVNSFSMLSPGGWHLSTPAELQAWGWTTMDLWVAPTVTALYALMTQIQPFWVQLSALLAAFAGFEAEDEKATPTLGVMDMDSARSVCIIILSTLFTVRAAYNFGGALWKRTPARGPKVKTQ
jgi:hypothetical protein